ncbi:hypothetical protein CPB84DRAFT_1692891 [Gymnopilus junonius]|uniref:Uncharacterized protein n=1 Tax=Gymnopilus junonius TaxID=109634 RepID=A0A9P5N990_GYMJU|nr:hypothetical protein CPB84DRAFT_1692891 [Gymnopilus junonius]
MDRKSFWYIHDLIQDDPIFKSTGKRPQQPPKYQLATFLSHVGSDSAIKTAAIMSIAEGTVYEYCPRVCQALLKMKPEFLAWPGTEQREFLSNEMSKFGFPGCLGSGES